VLKESNPANDFLQRLFCHRVHCLFEDIRLGNQSMGSPRGTETFKLDVMASPKALAQLPLDARDINLSDLDT
jgi:hypothetical protein